MITQKRPLLARSATIAAVSLLLIGVGGSVHAEEIPVDDIVSTESDISTPPDDSDPTTLPDDADPLTLPAESPRLDGGSTTAEASTTACCTGISTVTYRSSVVHKVKYTSRAGAQILGRCKVGRTGATCTISRGKSATRTIDFSGGVTRGMVAASLGISSASTETVDVGCTSPALRSGETWTAKPLGNKYTYDVKRSTYFLGVRTGTSIVATGLRSFSPYSSQIYCY